jgi:uncharacterized membrane protein YciS (DUF1049 family)
MKTFLKLIVLVPLAVIAVAFAVANRQHTVISFDPFATDVPAFALSGPLFLVLLIVVVAGVVIGGVASWLGQGRVRRALRLANRENDELHREVERLKTALAVEEREKAERAGGALAVLPSRTAA